MRALFGAIPGPLPVTGPVLGLPGPWPLLTTRWGSTVASLTYQKMTARRTWRRCAL